MSSTSVRRTPVHLALPTRLPPTSLLTHAMVTYCSMSGSSTSWSNVRLTSVSTMPWTRRFHVARFTDGVTSAVSIR